MLQAIRYSDASGVEVLDQLLLPHSSIYIKISNVDDAFSAIKMMQVRGAPAIAMVGMLGLAEELKHTTFDSTDDLVDAVEHRLSYLVTSRPTAVDLSNSAKEFLQLAKDKRDNSLTSDEIKEIILQQAVNMLEKDIATNKRIGMHGAVAIVNHAAGHKVRVLTHCNTGSLATAGYGTALGIIRSLHEKSILEMAYCTETRPYNQGSRLTAYELVHEKIPCTLICDNMVTILMEKKDISAVVVGADRVVANGDTANKIGTHQIAIVAKHFNVPFYIAAPLSSVDIETSTGTDIPIEIRAGEEMTSLNGTRIAAPGIECWNPAFDVTPASLITGIITENGVVAPGQIATEYNASAYQ